VDCFKLVLNYNYFVGFPDGAETLPAHEVACERRDGVPDAVLDLHHQSNNVGVRRDVGKIAEDERLVFAVDLLCRRLHTRAMQPASKQLGPASATTNHDSHRVK